mmetsp:Transcript_14657/g.30370  ORF Transcript_14657/g.30370 Transcript_14657/m.30370 type:complete len:111 (-) Transcript_14657:300-632(-)
MANTSDGNGDPPDPPSAHHPTDALRIYSPSMQRAKNDSIPTEIDDDMAFYDTDTSTVAPTPLMRSIPTPSMIMPTPTCLTTWTRLPTPAQLIVLTPPYTAPAPPLIPARP